MKFLRNAEGDYGGGMKFLVQVSSTAYHGGPDLCMKPLDGKPVWVRTCEAIIEAGHEPFLGFPYDDPGFGADLPDKTGMVFCKHADRDTPIDRLNILAAKADDNELIGRTDGINWAAPYGMVDELISQFKDCYFKFRDDSPPPLTFEIYCAKHIRLIHKHARGEYRYYPRFFDLSRDPVVILDPTMTHQDENILKKIREASASIYDAQSQPVDPKGGPGDQLSLHYEKAIEWIPEGSFVLDYGCGSGYGQKLMRQSGMITVGYDPSFGHHFDPPKAEDMYERDVPLDAITCMEVIEHVSTDKAREILTHCHRRLKPGGLLVLSTPQNCLGHIPINTIHIREYSLREIQDLVGEYFEIDHVLGIKAGRLIVPGDNVGTNTMVFARKR